MLAKMRKRWIHQRMQEATPRPAHVDEISRTEEEHKDIDHGNPTLCPLFSSVLIPGLVVTRSLLRATPRCSRPLILSLTVE